MCGINGMLNLNFKSINNLRKKIKVMNKILYHRGPDSNGIWTDNNYIGLGHVRLSIIDLSKNGNQPMINKNLILVFNGEIYNYKEIKELLKDKWTFKSNTDSEVIIALYSIYKEKCVDYLNGMFSFVIWDKNNKELFCARDRLGIKPFYYLIQNNILYFASEIKALIPFLETTNIEVDKQGMTEYLIFQYSISDNTIIKNIKQLMPAHTLTIKNNKVKINKYWKLEYKNTEKCAVNEYKIKIKELLEESIVLHLNSDVPISSYVSGGIDSAIVSILASKNNKIHKLFHGKFSEYPKCDESNYADKVSQQIDIDIIHSDINYKDFIDNIRKIVYHMDYPAAGPGVFPQYMVSKEVSKYTKVVLGGQGGDEIFGGYVRYIIPYFEKCISDALNGDEKKLLNLLPNMSVMNEYRPMLKIFWGKGLFEPLDKRYFRMCNRSNNYNNIINWKNLCYEKVYNIYIQKFNNDIFSNDDLFNKMLHFDLENSLPSLLHVEDRVSMACSIESRVPLLNHKLIEYIAKIPENIKINPGNMKHLLKDTYKDVLPIDIMNRTDKMGFPVPLNDWIKNNELKNFFNSLIISLKQRNLDFLNITEKIILQINNSSFSREYWILINIELWYQEFYDKFNYFKDMI